MASLKKYQGIVLITGASAGLGAEFARQAAAQNKDILLIARTKQKLEALAKDLSSRFDIKAYVFAQDLSVPRAAENIRKFCDDNRLTVGVLVNNAGIGSHGMLKHLDAGFELKMLDVNLRTPVALTLQFLPEMVERQNGGIIFLSSIAGYGPTPYFATYGATKAFNLLFGESLWYEARQSNVDVLALSPGYTRTEFQAKADVTTKALGGWATAEQVVRRAYNKLGKKPSTVNGFFNWILVNTLRITPRRLAVLISGFLNKRN